MSHHPHAPGERIAGPVPTPAAASHPFPSRPEPLGVDDREAARLMGVSARTVWSLRHSGQLPFRKIGRRAVISVAAIRDFLVAGEGGGK